MQHSKQYSTEESGKVLKFVLSFFIFIRADELCLFLVTNFTVHRTNFNTVSCIEWHIMHYVGPTVVNKFQEHGQNVIKSTKLLALYVTTTPAQRANVWRNNT